MVNEIKIHPEFTFKFRLGWVFLWGKGLKFSSSVLLGGC